MIYWGANGTGCVSGGTLPLGPRETVALAALISTHLYAVSSRYKSQVNFPQFVAVKIPHFF
jgi:hypothetical protein